MVLVDLKFRKTKLGKKFDITMSLFEVGLVNDFFRPNLKSGHEIDFLLLQLKWINN